MSVISAPSVADDFDDIPLPSNIKFQRVAFMSYAGDMTKVSFSLPFKELAEHWNFDKLLERHDFDLDDESTPGQRDITESHVKKIAAGIQSSNRPYLGNITVALAEEHIDIKPLRQLDENIWLVQITVYQSAPNPIVEDGQHRISVCAYLWPLIRQATEGDAAVARAYLEKTSVEMTILLEDDPAVLSTLFVKMNSTKPISPSLIAVMDVSAEQNKLGRYVTRRAELFKDRTGYLSTKAAKELAKKKGRTYDDLYPAASVRSAAASIAGVGVRDRTPEQREAVLMTILEERAQLDHVTLDVARDRIGQEIVAAFDYAYKTLPGWREMKKQTLTVADFKRKYVHSSAAGLHVIANVIAAGRAAGISAYPVIDALASLPWRRDALRDATDQDNNPIKVHEFFENTLVKTTYDVRLGDWRAGTGGATRSTYEPAIQKVLDHLAGQDSSLSGLRDLTTLMEIGLVAQQRGPGRPRKAAA